MKNISIVGNEIPILKGKLNYLNIKTKASLSDTDILVFDPSINEEPQNSVIKLDWDTSFEKEVENYLELQAHWSSEISHFLNTGGVLFVILSSKKGKRDDIYSNYYPLPLASSKIKNAIGDSIIVVDSLFQPLYKSLKKILTYEVFINLKENQTFVTPKKDRVLGTYYRKEKGIVILFPHINFEIDELSYEEDGEECWTDDARKLGQTFIDEIIKISKHLKSSSEKTPPPEWSNSSLFKLEAAELTKHKIEKNLAEINKLEKDNKSLKEDFEEQETLKELLYETGTPLEEAVRKALRILGYKAEGYDNGELELDQVITSPERLRLIGECEGKENKSIAIEKLNQLLRAIQDDLARDDISLEEKAHGLLIGNPFRLLSPEERKESPFTDKCLSTAKHSGVGLITTVDLFYVARYIQENNDEEFAKKCREAIYEQLGGVVKFPEISSIE